MGLFEFLNSIFGSGKTMKDSVEPNLDAVETASNYVVPSAELLPEQSEPKTTEEEA